MKPEFDKYWINCVILARQYMNRALFFEGRGGDLSVILKLKGNRSLFEAFGAAMYLVAVNYIRDRKYDNGTSYLQRNFDDPPDFYALEQTEYKGKKISFVEEIEVFEFTERSSLTLKEELQKKLDKAYRDNTVLVCFITNPHQKSTFRKLQQELRGLNSKNKLRLWIIAATNDKWRDTIMGEVYPGNFAIIIDSNRLFKTQVEFPIIINERESPDFFIPEVSMLVTADLRVTPSPIILGKLRDGKSWIIPPPPKNILERSRSLGLEK